MRAIRAYYWLGATVLGVGTALAGSGMALADGDTGREGTSRAAAHRQTAAARPRAAVGSSAATPPASASANAAVTGLAAQTAPVTSLAAQTKLRLAPATAATYTRNNPLPPRIQWNTNDGYCGEVSFINAGLYYGQYISQYDARALAGNNAPQNSTRSQLLLGVNDVSAAKAMHLTATPFNTATQTDTRAFLNWVKGNVTAGYPVAIGLYTNEFRFYGSLNPAAGDPQYDHIVTVTGVTSTQPMTGPVVYNADDVITFSDHGLWTGTPNGLPPYLFSYSFGAFPANRRKANAARGPVYSLPDGGQNYGIAITGVADKYHETVPVRLTTSVNYESPGIAEGSTVRPTAKPVTLTITVSGLQPGTTYNLYRYSSMAAVPDGSFNANAVKAAQKWTIVPTGASYTMTQTVMSNEVAVYRAVPTTAR